MVLNRFLSIKNSIHRIGKNPHIGDFPRENESLHLWTKPVKSITKRLWADLKQESIGVRGQNGQDLFC